MRFAGQVTKATSTYSEYVLVIAFTRQQRLREKASVLRYTYIAYLFGNDNRLILCPGSLIIVDVM
jgi:hypothetical protein